MTMPMACLMIGFCPIFILSILCFLAQLPTSVPPLDTATSSFLASSGPTRLPLLADFVAIRFPLIPSNLQQMNASVLY
jgi:hypothetical protein